MSDDLPDTDRKDTNPMLGRILDEVQALRELPEAVRSLAGVVGTLTGALAALDAKVERGFSELRAELARTRTLQRDELDIETRNIGERMAALERRMNALEEQKRPQ